MHPALETQGTFAGHKLGRGPVKVDPRTLRLARYLDLERVLPAIPDTFDNASRVASWPMYGNDRLGDCTIAALAHMIQAWSAAAHRPLTPDEAAVIRAYWLTGDPPADTGTAGGPTDTGRVELDVLNWWRSTGLPAGGATDDKLTAYVAVDPKDRDHMKAAIYLFGGVYTGIALPISAQRQQVWDVDPTAGHDADPGSWGGHAVPYEGYTPDGVTVITWGAPLAATWAFHEEYTEEVYAIVSADWLTASGQTIAGLDLAALQADLAQIAAGG